MPFSYNLENATLEQISEAAAKLKPLLEPSDRVILEGPMGAGKSTFARLLLEHFKIKDLAEGSPTFSIAHEYRIEHQSIVHIDLYRINHEEELEAAGIPAYFWETSSLILVEWLNNWESLYQSVISDKRHRSWIVKLDFVENLSEANLRTLSIKQL